VLTPGVLAPIPQKDPTGFSLIVTNECLIYAFGWLGAAQTVSVRSALFQMARYEP